MSVRVLEGGDAAPPLLEAYDRTTGTWSLPKEGEFWGAVGLAHDADRRGGGRRIAIIDDAFDPTIPALANHRLMRPSLASESAHHGSAVALLVNEVAPEAELSLYPVAVGGAIVDNLVAEALAEVADGGYDVVNISLGESHEWADVLAPEPDAGEPRSPPSSIYDYARSFALEKRGRTPVRTDHILLVRAARRIAERGATVVAAIGNALDKAYSPAIDDAVVACGFQTVRRDVQEGGGEIAWSDFPSFDQSPLNADILLVQPEGVLGSSFSAPLVAGFAALMLDRTELPAFLESSRLAAVASSLEPNLGDRWDDASHGVVDAIYKEALRAAPHRHTPAPDGAPCPECALFARPAYVDWGRFKASAGDLGGAELVLRVARTFVPFDVHAAVNLGTVLLEQVKGSAQSADSAAVLEEASRHLEFAVASRPGHREYAERLEEAAALAAGLR